jgi:5-methylcytosine-specific restriction protein A
VTKLAIRDPVEIPARRMTPARRARIFAAHNGVCAVCKQKIGAKEPWIADHRIPLEISGDDSDDNLQPIHAGDCNKRKTAADVKDIWKAKKRQLKHIGQAPPPTQKIRSRGFPKRWGNT